MFWVIQCGRQGEERGLIHRQVTVRLYGLKRCTISKPAISITNMITGLNPSYEKPVIKKKPQTSKPGVIRIKLLTGDLVMIHFHFQWLRCERSVTHQVGLSWHLIC